MITPATTWNATVENLITANPLESARAAAERGRRLGQAVWRIIDIVNVPYNWCLMPETRVSADRSSASFGIVPVSDRITAHVEFRGDGSSKEATHHTRDWLLTSHAARLELERYESAEAMADSS